MPRHTRWSDMLVGLIGLATVIAISLAVLVFARIGGMHGTTFELMATVGEARGVIHGTEVWLAGQKVGIVSDVRFMPPSAEPRGQILIAMDVLESARPHIRLDSHAQIRSGGSMIGAPVVYVNIGTAAARDVQPGDTLRSLPETDYESVASRFAVASKQFPAIISNIRLIDAQLRSVHSTLGAIGIEHGGVELPATQLQMQRLSKSLSAPRGTIGRALAANSLLSRRAQQVIAGVDSVQRLLASNRTSYGRFRRDSTLLRHVAQLRDELDSLQLAASSPRGTLGRMSADSTVARGIQNAQHEMALLFTDIQRHPFRYLSLQF